MYTPSGGWFNKKMSSYQYRKSHCGDKTILRPSYLHNGISYTGKTTSLYWIGALECTWSGIGVCFYWWVIWLSPWSGILVYTYDIRSVVGVYTPVGVATEWLWSVHSKLECTLRQGKGNHMHGKMWDKITYPFPKFNDGTVEVWEWISNFIPHFIMGVIFLSILGSKITHVRIKGPLDGITPACVLIRIAIF